MWDSVPWCDMGHLRQRLPSPPTTHVSPLGWDFVLGFCQAASLPLSFTPTHTGVRALIEAVGPGGEDTLAGQTRTWWSGDLGSRAGPAAHTLRSLGKDFPSPALRAPAS